MPIRFFGKWGWFFVGGFAIALTMLREANASASDFDRSMFSFSGFGTVGVVHSSEDRADFSSSTFKPNGAGHSSAWSTDVDSLIAGQVTADFTPRLSAVLQVVAEQNADNSHTPQVEWANIKYQFTPNFSARLGRSVLPVFLVSDYRKVAYAYPWVRPPIDLFQLASITGSDSVDANYLFQTGEFRHTLQASYGSRRAKLTAANAAAMEC